MGKANFTEDFKRDAVLQISWSRAIQLRSWRRGLGTANTRSTSGRSASRSRPLPAMTTRPLRSAG